MKILLINPPAENTVIENPDEQGKEFLEADSFGDFPPLGALYVLSYLENNTTGHEFYFMDCIAERMSHAKLPQYIEKIKPDIVGVTSFTVCLMDVVMVARTVREIMPNAHICLGGHHPIAYPFEAAQLPEFDSIVVGEGEIAFTDLVKCLENNEDFTSIKGVYTKDSIKKYRVIPMAKDKRFLSTVSVPPAYVDDINSLPPVNRKYIRHLKYHNILGVTGDLATVLSSRGCPYLCTFCDVPFKSYRPRTHELVVDEIEQCLAQGYKEIRFYDDLFNITPQKIIDFCDEVDKRGLKFPWDFRGRVNTVTYESLARAKKSGLRMISFGVETGTDAGLKAMKKGTNTTKVKKAFEWCRELGIITVADYIIGLPHEKNKKDINESIDFLISLDPDYAQISVLKLYPNTEMYDNAVSSGVIPPNRWKDFALNPSKGFIVDHWDEHMSLGVLVQLQKRAYLKFYFRPVYILRSLFKTRSIYELSSKFFGAIKLLNTNHRSV
jgi:radical SAM superfamily enzyme YgiQ (UPF0313 family)